VGGLLHRLTWKTGAESREEFHGIDPATGQWTIWGFDSKGRVYKGVGESAKAGEWSYRLRARARTGRSPSSTGTSSSGRTKIGMRSRSSSWTGKSSPLRYKCGSGRSSAVKSRQQAAAILGPWPPRIRLNWSATPVRTQPTRTGREARAVNWSATPPCAPRCPEFSGPGQQHKRAAAVMCLTRVGAFTRSG